MGGYSGDPQPPYISGVGTKARWDYQPPSTHFVPTSQRPVPSMAVDSPPDQLLDRFEVLYHHVLHRWRRSDYEGQLVTAEVRGLEATLERLDSAQHSAALARVLRQQHAHSLQAALRTWSLAATAVGAAEALQRAEARVRIERATAKEAEAQLSLAHESEHAVRAQWDADRQRWQRRELEEIELVAALGAKAHVAPPTAPAARAPTERRPQPRRPPPPAELAHGVQTVPPPPPAAAREPPARTEAPPPPPPPPAAASAVRPLGARAEQLLAALRRESEAVQLVGVGGVAVP